jgi:hypothetical protein
MRINWKWWRRMWRVSITRYCWGLLTPWFMFELRSGVDDGDWFGWNQWRGLRVYWQHTPGWNYKEGAIMFHKSDMTLGPYFRSTQRFY